MTEWLLKKIGIGGEFLEHIDQASLSFQHPLAIWFGLVLLVPIGVFIYWWQRRNLVTAPPLLRATLSLTRILILAMLILVLASPYLKIELKNEKKPIVAFLFDHSQSMQLPAGEYDSEGEMLKIAQAAGYRSADGRINPEARKALNVIGRAKLAQTVVQSNSKSLLEPLAKRFDVQFYGFARELTPLAVDPADPKFPEPPKPGGMATHIGDVVSQVLTEAGGRQVSGILIFSDGQNTGGRSPSEAAQAAAFAGTPLFTVPTGTSTRLKDVSIVDVTTSGQVAVGDTARVGVVIESLGFDKRPVKVQLKDGDKIIDVKDLVLNSKEQQQIELTFQAKEPGPRYLTVHIPPLPEEPEYLRGNNTDIAFVRVSEEKLRVLYVEGLPRWDFRFLKNAMRRDHGLAGRLSKEPDIVLEAEWKYRRPAEQAVALPTTLEALAEYHTVVLGDASPKLLTPAFVKLLDKAVREKGVGLLIAAGPLNMPHSFEGPLLDLLPVRVRTKVAGREAHAAKPFRLELSPDGAVHEAMRFYDDPGRNQNAWSHMPPYHWCVAAERLAPAATVLAANPNVQVPSGKLPLITYHYAGQGKVMLVGTDSTWLWRQNVGDRFFYKFWGQGLRFVARRDSAGATKSWMDVRPIRAQPGEQAQVELMAFNTNGSPRVERTLSVQVIGGGSASAVELIADPSTKGRYTGKFPLKATGDYRVTYATGNGAELIEGKVRVMVAPEELRHPNVNRPVLQQMASTSGGLLVELPDLGTIPERLKGESKHTFLKREATLWDNWLTLAILMGLYSFDVGLRRLVGLS